MQNEEQEIKGSEQALPAGTVLRNHYLLERVLGQGGFGITYLAYDRDLQVKRAVKEFFPQGLVVRTGSQVHVSRSDCREDYRKGMDSFYHEAMSIAQFGEHPNVVKIHDSFHENGTVYFVMDYIEGVSFRQYLKAHGDRIPLDDALRILRPIGDALTALHQAHLLHRDVKPDNIYITDTGTPILLDFGAARYETREKTHSSAAVLTPGYAPPEQYGSLIHQGPYTDVYALAATFYRALSGSVPMPSSDRVMEDTLPTLNRLNPKIPARVSAAVSHAMKIKSTDRTSSVAQFFNELDGRKKGSGIPLRVVLIALMVLCVPCILLLGRERFLSVHENTMLPTVTDTEVPTATDTEMPTAADTETPTAMDTAVPTAADTEMPIAADTEVPTATDTAVPTAADTAVPTAADTAVPTATDTAVPTATDTAVPTATDTVVPTATAISFELPERIADIEETGIHAIADIQDILQAQVGDRVHFGHLDQDNEPRTGKESILWRVLARDEEKVLLVSEYALDAASFNERKESTFWSYSTLRIWLNNDFYREAFNEEEQAMILQAQVQADRDAYYTLDSGRDSLDRVFLLSVSEAETYFENDRDRVCRPTGRSLLNGAILSEEPGVPAGVSWWLRSAGEDKVHAAYVMADGSVRPTGADVDRRDMGIRPAFWLSLANVRPETACTTAETCFNQALQGEKIASELIRRTAERGDRSAQCLMGYLICGGREIDKDETTAADWFRLAAEQGSAAGQYALGALYLTGSGVPEDAAEAAVWFRRAAEQGYAAAQYRLAALYEQGIGVPEDVSAAERWYQLAAVSRRNAVFEASYEQPLEGADIYEAQEGSLLYYGHLDQDRNAANGAEPVLWRVLKKEEDRLLLISEHGLDTRPYHDSLIDVTWEASSLRAWLNEFFFETVFSGAEKAGIPRISLPARSLFENDTMDKIFLLNIAEASRYFADSTDRQCMPSAAAISRRDARNESGTAAWWLLDPGGNEDVPAAVLIDAEGRIFNEGLEVDNENVLVRPAFWLSLSDVSF